MIEIDILKSPPTTQEIQNSIDALNKRHDKHVLIYNVLCVSFFLMFLSPFVYVSFSSYSGEIIPLVGSIIVSIVLSLILTSVAAAVIDSNLSLEDHYFEIKSYRFVLPDCDRNIKLLEFSQTSPEVRVYLHNVNLLERPVLIMESDAITKFMSRYDAYLANKQLSRINDTDTQDTPVDFGSPSRRVIL